MSHNFMFICKVSECHSYIASIGKSLREKFRREYMLWYDTHRIFLLRVQRILFVFRSWNTFPRFFHQETPFTSCCSNPPPPCWTTPLTYDQYRTCFLPLLARRVHLFVFCRTSSLLLLVAYIIQGSGICMQFLGPDLLALNLHLCLGSRLIFIACFLFDVQFEMQNYNSPFSKCSFCWLSAYE